MTNAIPTLKSIQKRLKPLTDKQIDTLSELSGISRTQIWRLRSRITRNPGIETVRAILDNLPTLEAPRAVQSEGVGHAE